MHASKEVNSARAGTAAVPLLGVLLAGALLFGWRLGSHDLWPPDEPRFALVAREMRERGDPVVLSLNDHLYTDKPPLFFWAINGFAWVRGGVDEWAARLPSAAAGLAAMLLLVLIGTWVDGRRTGILAALLFATAPQIAHSARWAQIDMTLNLCVLGAFACFLRGMLRPGASPASGRLAWVLMGLATLAKGPIGLVLPLLALVPACLLNREPAAARRLFPPSGVLLYLAVVLPWFALFAHRLGPGTAIGIATHQTVERYVDAWNGRHPVWYFLWTFPLDFAPWSLFLPSAVLHALSPDEAPRRRVTVILLAWFAAVFFFFSFSTGKRGVYLIPLYPAAALLVARLLARAPADRLRRPLLAWACLAPVLAAALYAAAARKDPALVPAAAAIGAVLTAGAVAGAWIVRRGLPARAAGVLVASMACSILIAVAIVQPWTDRYQNIRPFATEVLGHLRPEIPFGTTEQKREAWVFYTGRPAAELDTDAAVLSWMAGPGPRHLLIEEDKLAAVRDRLPRDVVEILRGRVAGQEYHLLGREP